MNIKSILNDEIKLNKFLLKNKGLIYRAIQKTYPSILNTPDEEDYVQEGMLSLYQAMNCFDEQRGVDFAYFAYIKIRNDLIKKLKRKQITYISLDQEIDDSDNAIIDFVPGSDNFEEDIFFTDLVIQINSRLSKKQKKIFELLLMEYSQADIARILDCSRENVRQMVEKIKCVVKEIIY